MTGMERNTDMVIMASYAPLFVNVNPGGMQWESDLIGYDGLTSYGSPSYWAQVMFGNHLGTEVVDTKLDGAGPRVYASTTRNEKLRKVYVKVVNGSSEMQRINFAIKGVTSVKPDALLITMSGKAPSATNTILHPDAIKPIEHRVNIEGLKFVRSFEPYSINVLEMSY
jgi:alpha-N-arabinofuranosidase